MAIESRNPSTGELIETFTPLEASAVELCVTKAASAFRAWRRKTINERATAMIRVADRLERDAESLGHLMALEMGKTAGAGRDEALKCAKGCRYYARHAEALLADEVVVTEARQSYVRYEPSGPILAIMPWNFPFWQVFRFAAPALMAGNVALLKHAPNVPRCALTIESLFNDAGFPDGVFQTLLIETDHVPALLADARIAAVTLTGSERAGREVASQAGRHLKKSVLELGGSDPFIVMPSADLARAVATAVKSRTLNNGQSCIAAKRFIVAESIAEAFTRQFVAGMAALTIGDAMDPATQVGPLARADLVDALAAQVDESVAQGARILTGGHRLPRSGFFYAPTVIVDIPRASPAYNDELFGPVASIFVVKDLDAAIALANDTRFGLGASVWTSDANEQARAIEGLDVGQVFVNALVASDPRVPFGGVKNSGYGRELGVYGIREFAQPKTVWIEG